MGISLSKLIITPLFQFYNTTDSLQQFLYNSLRQNGARHERVKKRKETKKKLIRKSRESMRMNKDDCVFLQAEFKRMCQRTMGIENQRSQKSHMEKRLTRAHCRAI